MHTDEASDLSELAQKGIDLYESRLKALLEPDYAGHVVAVHVDTADYAIGSTHSQAARVLLARHAPDGRIVTLTIGRPSEADFRLAARLGVGQK
jgi:hypothetical protein